MKNTSEASPTHDSDEPSGASTDASSDDGSTLMFVRSIAVVAVVATLIGRAFGSSLRGLAVGLGKHAERLEFLGAMLSKTFLFLGTIVSLGLVLAILRVPVSAFVRFAVITCGGLVMLATLPSMAFRMSEETLTISGAMACTLALVAAWGTLRVPFARAAAIILGGIGLGGVTRVIAILLLTRERVPSGYRVIAQGISTVGILFDGLAMAVAVGFVASRNRKPSSPATIIALGAALVATRLAMGGAAEDSGVVSVLFDRASRALLLRPEPFASQAIVTFFAFAAPALAIAVLATPTLTPALSGAIALALLAHGAPDVPLCGLMLSIASVATILASHDHRGIWTAIKRGDGGGESRSADGEHRSNPNN